MRPASRWAETLQRHWALPHLTPLTAALLPLAWLYGAAARFRRWLYAAGWRQVQRSPVPVIVVGNLVAGGGGKTPLVIWLVRALRQAGWKPGVVSRGHGTTQRAVRLAGAGSQARDIGDEPLLIQRRTDAPVAVGIDRSAAAGALCDARPDIDVIVADDGLQHLAWHRDLQVIVFDARGAGNGRLLPSGPLREPLPSRADDRTLVVYTAGRQATSLPGFVGRRALSSLTPLSDWWQGDGSRAVQPDAWRGRHVRACAALAQPQRFFDMLEGAGLTVQAFALPDHDPFDQLPWGGPDDRPVIVTEKDAVKLQPGRAECGCVWVAALDFDPGPDFLAAVLRLLPVRPPT